LIRNESIVNILPPHLYNLHEQKLEQTLYADDRVGNKCPLVVIMWHLMRMNSLWLHAAGDRFSELGHLPSVTSWSSRWSSGCTRSKTLHPITSA